jgi:hypothetical protein
MGRRRTLGYVENEWTCPNCGTRNKGSIKACENCGAPQPENVKFELPSEQKIVKDESAIKAAQAGADIHCGFCGTRNPATAKTCSQCGGDLKEGKARQAGRVMQTPPAAPKAINCNNCGTENPGTNSTCSNCGAALLKPVATQAAGLQPTVMGVKPVTKKKTNWMLIGGILGALALCCIGAIVMFVLPTSSVDATVTSVHWQTNVPVQKIQAVDYSNERGSPPSAAYDVSCHDENRDVCEQRTIDRGNGFSEVVEECHTETEQYCSYTLDEWETIQTYTLEGNDLQPVYDTPNYSSDQRIGNESAEFTVVFSTGDGTESYSPDSVSEFQQFNIGSTWILKMNALGGVISVER